MKGKIFLFLFAVPFFGAGAWMAWSAGTTIADSIAMRDWMAVEATVQRAGYRTHSGDDSNTYEAYADFEYRFAGQRYTGHRVTLSSGADNIGDYQQALGRRLQNALRNGASIVVYVNPDSPAQAIVDRNIRWGLIGFKSIFVLVFGGVGLGLMVWAFFSSRKKDPASPAIVERPWLAKAAWQTPSIRSSSRSSMWGSWAFAAFWNLISAPLPFVIYTEVTEKGNLPALLGLTFPIIGFGLLTWAVRRTLEWRRFGPAPVVLDPFPAAIGGHAGGTIGLKLSYDPEARFTLTLTCVYSYVSGSGKNRSRREDAKWQDRQVAHVASGAAGTRLSFRFDIPAGLAESDADPDDNAYHLWRLHLHAALPGVDVDRDYEIPVYPTGERSAALSGMSIETARGELQKLDVSVIEDLVRVSQGASGRALLYPLGRNRLTGFMTLLIGIVFTGAGWYLIRHEGHPFMGSIFGLFGVPIVLLSFYLVLNSLRVEQRGSELQTVRRVLGVPVRRDRMPVAHFERFATEAGVQTQSGKKHVVHYSVFAVDHSGRRLLVGEGFRGASQAEAAAGWIGRQFGLRARTVAGKTASSDIEELNYLAAD